MKTRMRSIGIGLVLSASLISAHTQESTSALGTVRDFLMDAIWLEDLGCKDCSPATQKCVRDVLKEFDYKNPEEVRLRKLSKLMIYGGMGQKNACAVEPFWGLPQYMFISEDWFKTLSKEEQRALIAHEATHLTEHHTAIKTAVTIACSLTVVGMPLLPIIMSILSKQLEYRADQGAVRLGYQQGMLNILKKFQEERDDIESERAQWQLLILKRSIKRGLHQFFLGSHPTPEDRMAVIKSSMKR